MQNPSHLVTLQKAGVRQKVRNGRRWQVRDVSFTLSKGEIITLIGPNGSGKSTTAKMALGVVKPDAGRCVRAQNIKVGYVPQKLHFDYTLPMHVARLMRLNMDLTDKEIQSALEQTEVAHLYNAQIHDLSGGELQRVLLARAVARAPDMLVLDEPVQGVDFVGEAALYGFISQVREQLGCGILMISHDLHVVMAATDKVICLNGHICCEGTPGDVIHHTQYQQLFGPRAEMLALYNHKHDHEHLPHGQVRHDGTTTHHGCSDNAHHHDGGQDAG